MLYRFIKSCYCSHDAADRWHDCVMKIGDICLDLRGSVLFNKSQVDLFLCHGVVIGVARDKMTEYMEKIEDDDAER